MSSARLSAAAPEQLQIPELPFKQGTSISHHHSFPGRAAAVYYKPQNVPHPLSLAALLAWELVWTEIGEREGGNGEAAIPGKLKGKKCHLLLPSSWHVGKELLQRGTSRWI